MANHATTTIRMNLGDIWGAKRIGMMRQTDSSWTPGGRSVT